MRRLALAAIVVLSAPAARPSARAELAHSAPRAPADSALPPADRIRLAEAFRLAAAVGDSVWAGWSAAPFAVLLVTPQREFLLRQPNPSAEFVRVGYDSLLQSDVFARPRVYPTTFLATFPAVAGVPTIVIGEAELTDKNSTGWVLTVLHEHFHQLQYSRPDYQAGVAALGLAHGDESGMWMLNFPFPYDSAMVQAAYGAFAQRLAAAMAPVEARARDSLASSFMDVRRRLEASLSPEQYRYLSFQLWQEGVARYTELAVARRAVAGYVPSAAFRGLRDFTSYSAEAARLERQIQAGVSAVRLGEERRVAFYAAGAANALLLDEVVPGWKGRYFQTAFSLDSMLH